MMGREGGKFSDKTDEDKSQRGPERRKRGFEGNEGRERRQEMGGEKEGVLPIVISSSSKDVPNRGQLMTGEEPFITAWVAKVRWTETVPRKKD